MGMTPSHLYNLYGYIIVEDGRKQYRRILRHPAIYENKILEGANSMNFPIERPARFKLMINRATADALALGILSSRIRPRARG
jgi:hypothetical protein